MKKKWLFSICLLAVTAGCSWLTPYTPPVEQGNRIDPKKVALLRVGMPKAMVQRIMGSPVLDDIFDQNRWDYVYTLNDNGKIIEYKRVTITFKNNKVSRIKPFNVKKS